MPEPKPPHLVMSSCRSRAWGYPNKAGIALQRASGPPWEDNKQFFVASYKKSAKEIQRSLELMNAGRTWGPGLMFLSINPSYTSHPFLDSGLLAPHNYVCPIITHINCVTITCLFPQLVVDSWKAEALSDSYLSLAHDTWPGTQ